MSHDDRWWSRICFWCLSFSRQTRGGECAAQPICRICRGRQRVNKINQIRPILGCIICILSSHTLLLKQMPLKPNCERLGFNPGLSNHTLSATTTLFDSLCIESDYQSCTAYLISCLFQKCSLSAGNILIMLRLIRIFSILRVWILFSATQSKHMSVHEFSVRPPTRIMTDHIFKTLESELRCDVVPAVVQSEDSIVLHCPVLHWERIQTWGNHTVFVNNHTYGKEKWGKASRNLHCVLCWCCLTSWLSVQLLTTKTKNIKQHLKVTV